MLSVLKKNNLIVLYGFEILISLPMLGCPLEIGSNFATDRGEICNLHDNTSVNLMCPLQSASNINQIFLTTDANCREI